MMHAVELIAKAKKPDYQLPEKYAQLETAPGICCVTAVFEQQTIKREKKIARTFTNRNLFRAPYSPRISMAAVIALDYRPQRMSSWLVDEKRFVKMRRVECRGSVLAGPDVDQLPWAGYITTSYKKHGALSAPVNAPGQAIWNFEGVMTDCSDKEQVLSWYERMQGMRLAGYPRPCLDELSMSPGQMEKLGYAPWMRYCEWAEDKVNTPLYRLLCYLMPSEAEIKEGADLPFVGIVRERKR